LSSIDTARLISEYLHFAVRYSVGSLITITSRKVLRFGRLPSTFPNRREVVKVLDTLAEKGYLHKEERSRCKVYYLTKNSKLWKLVEKRSLNLNTLLSSSSQALRNS